MGNTSAYKLFETVKVIKKEGVDILRAYSDYDISVEEIPSGVTCMRM